MFMRILAASVDAIVRDAVAILYRDLEIVGDFPPFAGPGIAVRKMEGNGVAMYGGQIPGGANMNKHSKGIAG